jgi:predicted CXXCH cytochrome family protein
VRREKKTRKAKNVPRPPESAREQRPFANRRFNWLWIVAAIPLVLLAIFFAYRALKRLPPSGTSHVAKSADDSSGYVDPQICASCHGDIAESFHRTGMGRSLYHPTASNRIEDYARSNSIFNRRSDSYYTMVERDGTFYQQRYQLGPGGRKINFLEERVDYIVGSGDQARSYLHRDAENRLIELPVTWYSENHGYWAMTPGYDQLRQQDFHGPISYGCFFCHKAYPRTPTNENVRKGGEPIFPATIPEGIDCQRCHGPGQAHVKAASNANSTVSQIRNAIVNPARLSRDRQLEVCMECHLSTSRSQDDNVSRRLDREVFSFIPGQPLADYKLYFDRADAEEHKDKFDIVDAAYRLSFSACFRNSTMTCLTCHDPHVEAHGQAAESRYIQVCESCHKSVRHTVALSAGETCISCHMPRRRSHYAVHIVLTDHYIQRNKPAGDVTAPFDEPENMPEVQGNLVSFYPKQLSNDSEDKLYLAAAQLKASNGDRNRIQEFEQAINQFKPAQAEFYAILGEAYAQAGNAQAAEKSLGEANARAPEYRPILEQLVKVLFSEGKYQQAAGLLKQSVETPPLDSALFADLGNAYARMGNLDEAEAALTRSIEIDPETAQARNLLGLIAIQRGNAAQAEQDFREALRTQPDLAEADDNLGKLLLGSQDLKQAEYYLKRAVTMDPNDADSHHSYGLLLMLEKELAPSAQELRTAISLNPGDALAKSDLGDVLSQQGNNAGAVQAYEQALRLEPDLPQANLGLGTLLRRQGQIDASRKLCQIASQSPDESIRDEALSCLQ